MKRLLILLVWFYTGLISAQDNLELREYFPPSPTAQEFIKYGEYPVGMHTGVPNISVPLYNIDVKDIQLPISMSYHASGIQVDQLASWVGLGWSINSGGMISKSTRGIPDDEQNGFLRCDLRIKNETKTNIIQIIKLAPNNRLI